jgi:hypothetical protein
MGNSATVKDPPESSRAPSSEDGTSYGPQFIARDFKEFIRLCGMTHVRTSLFYSQSNVGTNR